MNLRQTFRIQNLDKQVIAERSPAQIEVEIAGVDRKVIVFPTRNRVAFVAQGPNGGFDRAYGETASQAVWNLIGKTEGAARKAA